jgi:hypothetical protein
MCVWLELFGSRQFSDQLVRVVYQDGQVFRANIEFNFTIYHGDQRDFLLGSFTNKALGDLVRHSYTPN